MRSRSVAIGIVRELRCTDPASADGKAIAIKSASTPEVTVYHVEKSGIRWGASAPMGATSFSRRTTITSRRSKASSRPGSTNTGSIETRAKGSPSKAAGAQPSEPRQVRISSPAGEAILAGIDRTGNFFAVQDPTGAQTTIWNVQGPEAKLAASVEGASFIPSFGGFKVIVRDSDGNAKACELYRLESPKVRVWWYEGALVSCDVSEDGQVAVVASSNEAGRITLRVYATSDTKRDPAILGDLPPETRYMITGDAAKYLFVAVPEPAAKPPIRRDSRAGSRSMRGKTAC